MGSLLVVGAGLYGLTVAEHAARYGHHVQVIDQRPHLGGNAWSYPDPVTGIEVHAYGSHIFHTSNDDVWRWVNRYSDWQRYDHRVFTERDGTVLPMPINLATINTVYSATFTPSEARARIAADAVPGDTTTFEGRALATVGPVLYDAVIRHYTGKQWQIDPALIPADVFTRLPVRYTYDTRYFTDTHQALPVNGYGAWLTAIAESSPRITVTLNTPYQAGMDTGFDHVVWSAPLDEFFRYRHGRLGWRTLDLRLEHPNVDDYQGCVVMNNADPETPWTRVHEFKHYRQADAAGTVIMREFSRTAGEHDERYYPVRSPQDRTMLAAYREATRAWPHVTFGGRLGSYQYLDMHMAIAAASTAWRNTIQPSLKESR